ncbi:MAG: HEAT repeat domain-containing protein [Acidobacteria bacterium]|nr:HEAT repeat domain-containing protein [Acidobacteriota bacterium]
MPQTFKLISRRNSSARRVAPVAVALLAFVCTSFASVGRGAAHALPQDYSQKLERFVQQSGATPAMRVFAEGRDLLDAGEWAKAAEKFQSFINAYPNDKDVDAACFWLAYSFNKQGRKGEAKAWLDKLFREFPKSSWKEDAKALAVQLGDAQAVKRGIEGDDNDEIKIIALQSLFENNEERAVEYAKEMLQNPATSQHMKEAVVSLLGSHGGKEVLPLLVQIARTDANPRLRQTAIHRLGEEGGESVLGDLMSIYQSDKDEGVKQQVLHALSEMESAKARELLLQVARNQSEDLQLRLMAIHWLGERDDSAFADLSQIYDSDSNGQVRVQVLHAFSEMNDPRAAQKLVEVARAGSDPQLRAMAIHWLGEKESDAVVEELMKIYDADSSGEVKMQILHSFSEMRNPRAKAKLMDAARSSSDPDLRASAIHWLGEDDSPQTVEMLVQLYDSEKSADVKQMILHAFSESRQKAALRKLIDVARRDPSMELRKAAIHWIGESRDPEALKFLEEIIKQ